MNDWHFSAIRRIDGLLKWVKYPPLRRELQDIKYEIEQGSLEDSHAIDNALAGALRGSEFEGDWVGRFDDDFDEDNDDRPIYF